MEWVIFALATSLKLLLIPAYYIYLTFTSTLCERWKSLSQIFEINVTHLGPTSSHSTDFEVHRNWLAITHSLPVKEWYYENTSEWTLDYPPFFAYFEWILSQLAPLFDPGMVVVSNLNYASSATILFQRLTVIVSDLVLFFAAKYFARHLSKAATIGSNSIYVTLAIVLNFGLFILDHVHFQYNGFLFGVLILSITAILEDRVILGSILFAALLNLKHIYIYIGPVYFVFLLRSYCFSKDGFSIGRFLALGLSVGAVFALSLGPFLAYGQLPQLQARLFPFKRGLVHAYWAPNVWALYLFADRALRLGLTRFRILPAVEGPSVTSGLVGVGTTAVLPNIPPVVTFGTTALAMLPGLIWLWKNPRKENFVPSLVYVGLCAFMFGWHVHEKAILIAVIPLALISLNSDWWARQFLVLSTIGHFSLFPLLFEANETPVKVSLFISYTLFIATALRNHFRNQQVLGWVDLVLLSSIVPMQGLYSFGSFILPSSLEFLPLMTISVGCAVVISIVWLRIALELFSTPIAPTP